MRILLSNDDSILSPNLQLLHAALKARGHELRVVAPASQHSGAGSSLTVHEPILWKKISLPDAAGGPMEGISVQGTPADCTILALRGLLPGWNPELVISGVNIGPNAGMDIFFSGTVGAAAQGAMYGIRSIAVSHCSMKGMNMGHAELCARLAEGIASMPCPPGSLWNLNIPECPADCVRGLRVCRHSTAWPPIPAYEKRISPQGTGYFWMKNPLDHYMLDDGDTEKTWLHRNWATVTPLRFDLNDDELLASADALAIWNHA